MNDIWKMKNEMHKECIIGNTVGCWISLEFIYDRFDNDEGPELLF